MAQILPLPVPVPPGQAAGAAVGSPPADAWWRGWLPWILSSAFALALVSMLFLRPLGPESPRRLTPRLEQLASSLAFRPEEIRLWGGVDTNAAAAKRFEGPGPHHTAAQTAVTYLLGRTDLVTIRPDSGFLIDSGNVGLIYGEAWCTLNRHPEAPPLRLLFGDTLLEARKASFGVRLDDSGTSIHLEQGDLDITVGTASRSVFSEPRSLLRIDGATIRREPWATGFQPPAHLASMPTQWSPEQQAGIAEPSLPGTPPETADPATFTPHSASETSVAATATAATGFGRITASDPATNGATEAITLPPVGVATTPEYPNRPVDTDTEAVNVQPTPDDPLSALQNHSPTTP